MGTSDELKNYLTQNFGGAESDWKRLSKNSNDQGQPVRVFENKRGGEKIEVTETGAGQFTARSLSDAAKEVFIRQEDKTLYVHAVETDAEKIALAKKLVTQLVKYGIDGKDEEGGDLYQEQVEEAGIAMANQFLFSVCVDDMGAQVSGQYPYAVMLTPVTYFKKHGYAFDQHAGLEGLLPEGASEVTESSFSFERADGSAVYYNLRQLMQDMLCKGFVYDQAYQAKMDRCGSEKLADKISKAMEVATPVATPPAPKN